MSNISTPTIFNKEIDNRSQELDEHQKTFKIPFGEYDLLQLQALFIKTGIHVIKTTNINDGRKIMKTILDSLQYYHNVACISKEDEFSHIGYDVMHYIGITDDNLENFFIMHPSFDFVWIEFSSRIYDKYTLQDIKKIFNMFHVQDRMSVLIVQYEE